ncbi:hypothetical protein BDR26DRAFT_931565 [Obelidium mucronatum]|nr:hypothetical protein BDR26DRAFT_931565 [Obelidium mucronatum]
MEPFNESKSVVGIWGRKGLLGTEGFAVELAKETPNTISSLSKKILSSVDRRLVPGGFWVQLKSIVASCHIMILKNYSCLPPLNKSNRLFQTDFHHRITSAQFAYFLLHLQRVASFAQTNFMIPKNHVTCIFITAKPLGGAEYLIRHASAIFGNLDLVEPKKRPHAAYSACLAGGVCAAQRGGAPADGDSPRYTSEKHAGAAVAAVWFADLFDGNRQRERVQQRGVIDALHLQHRQGRAETAESVASGDHQGQRRQSVPHIHIGASNLKDGNIKQKISSRNPSDTPSPLNLFDKEGPLFNTTIYEASMRAGKNGIPDIVIQCVEYLVHSCIHKVDGDTIATPQLKRSSEVKSSRRGSVTELIHSEGIGAAAGIQRRQTVSSRVDQLQVPEPTAISDVNDCSHFAISGSNAELAPTETTKTALSISTATTSNTNKSLITSPFEESKRGVGLWDDEGIFGTVGFPFQLELETPGTVASLLKKYLSSIKGGFVPDGFWKEMDEIAKVCGVVQPPTTPIIEQIKTLIQDKFPSKQHIHTFAYFVLHLQQVASYADTNFMTPRNLVLCIFISAGDGGELLIRHADVVFGNVDLVGRETVALLPKLEEQEVKAVAYMSLNRSLNRADSDGCLFLDKWFKSHMTYDPRKELLLQQQQQQAGIGRKRLTRDMKARKYDMFFKDDNSYCYHYYFVGNIHVYSLGQQ